ncbi:MAG TPA: cobalamin-independent methionine synthase II family protein, partial [Chloroflexota bacterium]|nr:cobalamin-independent methionine synthase II family protein [Chloroflexota bacterium]
KLLTTHVGSLPFLRGASYESLQSADQLRAFVTQVVAKQRETGLDVINEGEYTKGGDWLSYMDGRLAGVEARPLQGAPIIAGGKDRDEFAEFYAYAAERQTLFYLPGGQIRTQRPHWYVVGPLGYAAQAALQRELEVARAAIGDQEAFITSTAPASLEPYYSNEFYRTDEEFLIGLAEALRVEYEAIVDAGFILQVDDAWLPALWDRIGIGMGLEAYRRRCFQRVEALNHALANIPEDRVRYHLCWGSWHGPHVHDLGMKDLVDVMLSVKAQMYLFEAANPRHEHEHVIWERVKLPAGKIIAPGVVTHSTDVVEHPELVAQRIGRYAALVGKENVVATADCGFGGRSHPQIAWAKLHALVEGAGLFTAAG